MPCSISAMSSAPILGTMASANLGHLSAAGDQLTGALLFKAGTNNIASAATLNLTSIGANAAHVTGTTGISALTMTSGQVIDLVFDGALTLTHHAANNNLPGGVPITTAAGDRARYWYDGTTVWCVAFQRATGAALAAGVNVQGAHKNLKIVASGLTNTSAVVTASQVMTYDGITYRVTNAVNVTVNSTASGANGLDTGTVAANTWYSVWVIVKPDGTTAGLLSLASSGPTMPSGYTYKARVGWVRTDGTANKYLLQTLQVDNRANYVVLGSSNVPNLPQMASGTLGTYPSTYAAIATGNYVPTTASRIAVLLQSTANSVAGVAPNNSYGAVNSMSNPPPLFFWTYPNGGLDLALESSNLYAVSSNTVYVNCYGWEDNL